MVAHAAKRGRPRKVHGAESAQATGENLGLVVGQNMKRLRSRRSLSLEGLAKLSGVSRAMLGQIELGRSVPTINVVWKIAVAFQVPFSTLISTSESGRIWTLAAKDSKVLTSANGEFSSRALFPFNQEHRTEFYELRLKPGGTEIADAHAPGTTENLAVVRGALEIEIGSEVRKLAAGDAILFQADQPHTYRNPSKAETLAYLVMNYVEPTG
ncbi:MAG TPA: XRE family transcriptional regulator [Alphaproteobacteria bacterium]|nr:XRE family transcriptional regulator [Alphaproteobacteria bacterium]